MLHVLFVTGMFAAMLSFHNVVARYAFAMGREGLLPSAFGRTTGSSGAPGTGSLLQTAVSAVIVVAFALVDDKPTGDPTEPVLHLFTWFGNIGALGVILLMAAASVSVIVFFARRGSARAQAWRLVTSALAGIALVVIAVYTVKDFDVLVGAGPDSSLSWILPGIVGLAVLVGLAQGLFLRARDPEAHARIGLGNEAFQLEKAAGRRRSAARSSPGSHEQHVRSGYGSLTGTRDLWPRRGRGCSNECVNPEQPEPAPPEEEKAEGRPFGRRVLLGTLGLGALGVITAPALQKGMEGFLGAMSGEDPTGLTGLLPNGGGFRYYSVTGSVPNKNAETYRLTVDGLVDKPATYTLADLRALPQTRLVKDVQCVTGWRVPGPPSRGCACPGSWTRQECVPRPGRCASPASTAPTRRA